jgi:hypothetical protein
MRFPKLIFMIVVFGICNQVSAADDRAPVPTAEEQASALKLIKEVFKADYARMAVADKLALAEKLLKRGDEARDDPVARYVLLREARDLAARAANLPVADRACDGMVRRFVVSRPAACMPAYQVLSFATNDTTILQALCRNALQELEDALAADDFDTATGLHKAAAEAARRAKSQLLLNQAAAGTKEIARNRQEFDRIQPVVAALQKNPQDAAANLALGKYLCFLKGQWEKGLPHLVRGNDDKLAALARKDLQGPREAADQAAVGDGWYDLSSAPEMPTRIHLQIRAHNWYEKAAPGVSGLTKVRIDKRLPELAKVVEGRQKAGNLWLVIRDGIRTNQVQETQAIGGDFANVPFKENLPAGSLLIGFHYSFGKWGQADVIDFLQAIYLTPTGEKVGPPHGKPKLPLQMTRAKKGYAVGGMTIRGGATLDGFAMTFLKIDGEALKKDDSYKSDWIGGRGGREGTLLGDGSLVIGICGKRFDDTKVGGLGLMYLKADPPR